MQTSNDSDRSMMKDDHHLVHLGNRSRKGLGELGIPANEVSIQGI